jgi:hypothetical protein
VFWNNILNDKYNLKEYKMKKNAFFFTILVVFAMIPLKVFCGELEIVSQEGKKYALVIGNNNYSKFPQLKGAGKDAIAIAEKLTKLDFEVTILTNATVAQMNNAIDVFATQLRSSFNNQGFFWFSGHGVQLEHMGYMTGIDADTVVERIKSGVVHIGKIFEALKLANNVYNAVILDTEFYPLYNETAVSLESALLQQLSDNICYIRSTSMGENSADNSPFIGPVLKYLNIPSEMASSFSAITEETFIISENRQRPFYYIPTVKER